MKRLWKSRALRRVGAWGLGLALGLAAADAQAGDVEWRPAAAPKAAATLATPRPIAPAAQLDRPQVRPVGHTEFASEVRDPVFRAQKSDLPRIMPMGPDKARGDAPKGAEPLPPPKGAPGDDRAGSPMPPPATWTAPPPNGATPPPTMTPPPGTVVPPGTVIAPSGPVPVPPPSACFASDGACVGGSCAPCAPCGPCGPCDRGGWFGWLRKHGDGCCDGSSPRFWISGEYLMWWMKGDDLPPLVTVGNPLDDVPGALGQPGTQVIFGGDRSDPGTRSGARFRAGYWFNCERTCGIDGSFFFLGQRSTSFVAGSEGAPSFFRPFFREEAGLPPDAEIVSFTDPNVAGVVGVSLSSKVWGAEANLRKNLARDCWWNLDAIAGFRYFGLDETLDIAENVTQRFGDPANFVVRDSFQTRNRFYGGQLGLEAEMRWGRWSLDLRGKVALGNVNQTVTISGATAITPLPGGPTTVQPGGLLALPSNMGRYSRDRFGVLPEVGVNLGYQVTDHLRAFVGYNFLYLSDVVRPGEQVDLVLNTAQLPRLGGGGATGGRPTFAFHDTDFWLHGVNFGLEFRW